jgi:hypothetical protein
MPFFHIFLALLIMRLTMSPTAFWVATIGHRCPIVDTSGYYWTPMSLVTGTLPVLTANLTCVFPKIPLPAAGNGCKLQTFPEADIPQV